MMEAAVKWQYDVLQVAFSTKGEFDKSYTKIRMKVAHIPH